MAATPKKNPEFLVYKGRPLLRQGQELYYGDMRDPYIVMLRVLDSSMQNDFNIATRVGVSLLKTAETENPLDQIVKHGEKGGLYDALEIGAIWLERALAADDTE
ncbi:MAG: hypothetical protein GX929_02935 [Clostridiales bacterium]|jgi:hypothetical protein|nr:hypothetical protein [Clostridiales bacterium]